MNYFLISSLAVKGISYIIFPGKTVLPHNFNIKNFVVVRDNLKSLVHSRMLQAGVIKFAQKHITFRAFCKESLHDIL